MALYTNIDAEAFGRLAEAYGLGTVREFTGIPQGSINSNYRLVTTSGRFFVRHTTVRSAEVLRFEAELLALLHESHCPAPRLLLTREGAPCLEMEGGRVSVFAWLAGEELTRAQLTPEHLESLGLELGKLHRVTLSFSGSRPNPYGPEVVGGWLEELERHPDAELSSIAGELRGYLARAESARGGLEPRGIIHADLFMDNVKWLGDRVSAFFDFEMACRDFYALDVAITFNAWCFDNGAYRPELCRALLRGYQVERSLVPVERESLFGHALFGAVRYTASRIRDFHLSGLPPDKLAPKDFRTYLARARALSHMGPEGLRALAGV
ncbi:homoserine kinase type II [Archangium gephyra]|uniref:Homoserine kinase n=1 Tax=Archangium gephyra TaxID=48 RepID=A0AAC8QE76_9BACT|nr:homoserine kinase [Archangium gephyra]AKJ05679.1 Homoserine kinase [Archangium gephyra]REG36359.1 homoserine kinase type II [Archangium gephyra]